MVNRQHDGQGVDFRHQNLTTSIINSGFESKVFEIVGAPSWMEVTPSSGVIGGDEELTITMSAPEFMDIGQYEFDLMLKGGLACGAANSAPPGFCYGERFTFGLDVYVEPPVFEVDEWAYQMCPSCQGLQLRCGQR